MSYILLILLVLIFIVFVLPTVALICFFFIKRNSIANINEVINSILYKFVNESATETNNEAAGNMSRSEALKILGLTEDAKSSDINQAYHNLMRSLHPDKGGSAYLAQKINEARDVLLK